MAAKKKEAPQVEVEEAPVEEVVEPEAVVEEAPVEEEAPAVDVVAEEVDPTEAAVRRSQANAARQLIELAKTEIARLEAHIAELES